MRRAILSVAALLVIAQVSRAASAPRGSTIDGKALADAVHDFGQELRANVQRDTAIWRERTQKMRQEFRDRLINDESSRRRLLSTTSNTGVQTQGLGWELILDAGNAVRNVIDAGKVKVHEFFSDILGHNWSSFAPIAWLNENFSWENLGMFDFSTNLQDFMSSDLISNFERPQNLGELYNKLETAVNTFCEPEEYCYPHKEPTMCEGPSVKIEYVPKSCIIDSHNKQIICDPAKLVLIKKPGKCTLKHYDPFKWTGKECKLKALIGLEKEKVIGGGEYTIDLTDIIQQRTDAIMSRVLPDAPPAVSWATTSNEGEVKVMWTAADTDTLQGVFKYVVKCTNMANSEEVHLVKVIHTKREAIIGNGSFSKNTPLTVGQTYACAVAGMNLKGTGPFTEASPYLVPSLSG